MAWLIFKLTHYRFIQVPWLPIFETLLGLVLVIFTTVQAQALVYGPDTYSYAYAGGLSKKR